jgi:short-subunit dehydrogenase
MKLAGKTVLITGASSGIGRASALAFGAAQANVVLAARRLDRLEALGRDLETLGVRALAVGCDVTLAADRARLLDRTREAFGGLDVLMNNAGVGLYAPLEATDDAQLRRVFELNVFSVFALTREALPLLEASRGTVLNVSSVVGHRGVPLVGGYSASKAALNALSEAWRAELSPKGVKVLVVSPGFTATEFRDHRLTADGWAQGADPLQAMSSEEVARALVRAVERGRAQTVLTLAGKTMVWANRLVPRLFDRLAPRLARPKR